MVERCEETSDARRSDESVGTKLRRIAEKARQEAKFRFTNLYYLMNEELLRGCCERLKDDAAAGIDNVTKEMYAIYFLGFTLYCTRNLKGNFRVGCEPRNPGCDEVWQHWRKRCDEVGTCRYQSKWATSIRLYAVNMLTMASLGTSTHS